MLWHVLIYHFLNSLPVFLNLARLCMTYYINATKINVRVYWSLVQLHNYFTQLWEVSESRVQTGTEVVFYLQYCLCGSVRDRDIKLAVHPHFIEWVILK